VSEAIIGSKAQKGGSDSSTTRVRYDAPFLFIKRSIFGRLHVWPVSLTDALSEC